MIEASELIKHNSKDSCWIVVHGSAYDVTGFLSSHPGGTKIILQFGGQDATEEYASIHPPELIKETLPSSAHLGSVDLSTLPPLEPQKNSPPIRTSENSAPDVLININDFETAAEKVLKPSTWAYISSAADDEISKTQNNRAFQKVSLRPRILRRVGHIDTRTTILGKPSSMPVFVSPCGLNKLAHPGGECAITSAVGKDNLIQVVSTGSSMSIEDIMNARVSEDQPIFFQLYVNRDVTKSEALLRRVEKAGVSAIWLTVDSPVLGKRERDDRIRAQEDGDASSGGVAKASAGWITSELQWSDLQWIREATSLPLVIKGIQCVEDAILAYEHGVQGIVISNHGGRSQDTSQAPLLTLLEIRKYAPYLINSKMEIYLDGGIRRGTDVLKAIALGATAVGLGRPFLHALAVDGSDGVTKMVGILREELRSNMALAGAIDIQKIVPEMVNTKKLERDLTGSVKL